MQNTNTIYFPSDTTNRNSEQQNDSICLFEKPVADTVVVYSPERMFMPVSHLKPDSNILASLVFTTVFLIIFAFVRLRGKDLLPTLFSVVLKRKKTEIILNEGISSNLVYYLLSLLLSFFSIAVSIIYFAQQRLDLEYSLYICGGLLVYHFFLLSLIKLLGWTFNARAAAAEASVNIWAYHIMWGLVISPFVIAIFFVKAFAVEALLKIIICGLILFYIIKFIRWIEILFAYRVLILYMILYLCALEVMPILVLYRLVA